MGRNLSEAAAHADLVIVYHHNHFWGARRVTGMSFRPLVQTEEARRGVPYLARTGEARATLSLPAG
jgi:poly-gamma-glutamate capsule biosynthesis protein CapA/YwtB (metallophosphatase superfamily)